MFGNFEPQEQFLEDLYLSQGHYLRKSIKNCILSADNETWQRKKCKITMAGLHASSLILIPQDVSVTSVLEAMIMGGLTL